MLSQCSRPVLFFVNGIGDYLLTLPTLRALVSTLPTAPFIIWGQNNPLSLFSDFLDLNSIEICCSRSRRGLEFDRTRATSVIEHCDLFISLTPWYSSSLAELVVALQPSVTIGFAPNYDLPVTLDDSSHIIDAVFQLAIKINPGATLAAHSHAPQFAPQYNDGTQAVLSDLPPGIRCLVVHGDTLLHKMWVLEHWVRVLASFLKDHKDFVALLLGSVPLPLDCGQHSDRIIPCYGVPLATSFALVRGADLFIGVDSCLLHAADLFRIPSVGLFGPTLAQEYGSRFAPHISLQGAGDMAKITPDAAILSLNRLLTDQNCFESIAC